ncbi:MAG: histidinol dehydrogenase [Phycisphaerae bacterium]|nr:histidinol dehydrogenase [Phycisphaerae bacterium]
MTISILNVADEAGLSAANALVKKLRLGTAMVAGAKTPGQADPSRAVADIIDAVGRDGDDALIALTEKFDKTKLTPDRIRVSQAELAAAHRTANPAFLAAARVAIRNIREYQLAIRPREPAPLNRPGMSERLRLIPLERVGCYVPGGAASYPSSVMMLAVPAQVAGVKQVCVACPPRAGGDISPAVLAVCHELSVEEVYRVGGAQAIAALALGTKAIRKVDKIVGPGNLFVQLAKKQLYGQVDIDSFAGPSEVLILADATATPEWVAADLLSQAEHNPGCGLLVTPDENLAAEVSRCVDDLLARCSRRAAVEQSLREWSGIVLVPSMDDAIDWANHVAPEHLQVITADDERVTGHIRNAGVIFVGPYTPVATGDYIAGSSHVLPTGGTARYFAGLSVFDFLRPVSVVHYEREGLASVAADIETLASAEGLDAHALSVKVRLES